MKKDYYAILRIQQGRLRAAMQELGIKTAAELSRRSGVSQSYIGDMLNFRVSPRFRNGEWRKSTLKICKALCYEPSELFPDHLDREIATNKIEAFVEQAQLSGRAHLQLGTGEYMMRHCDKAEAEEIIDEALGTLTERERNVLKARFWEKKTFTSTGRAERVSDHRELDSIS